MFPISLITVQSSIFSYSQLTLYTIKPNSLVLAHFRILSLLTTVSMCPSKYFIDCYISNNTWVIKVPLSFTGKLPLLNTQFFVETFLADDVNVLADIRTFRAVFLKSLDYSLTDCRLKHSTVSSTNIHTKLTSLWFIMLTMSVGIGRILESVCLSAAQLKNELPQSVQSW